MGILEIGGGGEKILTLIIISMHKFFFNVADIRRPLILTFLKENFSYPYTLFTMNVPKIIYFGIKNVQSN